ncbi:MAG: flagellar biosynthesis repressor FlbT [Alphaproteobacteria bacterium]
MPLKIRVKPEQKFFAGGAVLKNVGAKAADLLVLSDSPVLREGYMMNTDRSEESDAATVYFLLQMIYLFKGKGQPLDNLVIDTIDKFAALYPHLSGNVTEIVALLRNGESFKALKLGHDMLSDYEAAKPKTAPVVPSPELSLQPLPCN